MYCHVVQPVLYLPYFTKNGRALANGMGLVWSQKVRLLMFSRPNLRALLAYFGSQARGRIEGPVPLLTWEREAAYYFRLGGLPDYGPPLRLLPT
jgi:hypothetical protein